MEVILKAKKSNGAKACKECGSDPKVEKVADLDVGEMYRVICWKCGKHTARKFSEEKAVRIWNRVN